MKGYLTAYSDGYLMTVHGKSVNEDCIKFCTRVMTLTALGYLNS